MIRDKKGMQVAINTVVGLILGGLMFIGGMVLLGNIIFQTESLHDDITNQMEQDIINAFSSSAPIYVHNPTLSPSKSRDVVIFGIGVHNIFNVSRDFKVSVGYSDPDDKLNKFTHEGRGILISPPGDFEIDARDKVVAFIVVPTGSVPRGQHPFILNISYENAEGVWVQYDRPSILSVDNT